MKVWLDMDEIYPAFYISESKWGVEVDIPQEILNRWEAANTEWHKCQNILDGIYDIAKRQKILESTKQGVQSRDF